MYTYIYIYIYIHVPSPTASHNAPWTEEDIVVQAGQRSETSLITPNRVILFHLASLVACREAPYSFLPSPLTTRYSYYPPKGGSEHGDLTKQMFQTQV